jgi:FlaA1/EpsC-like NDP-sugar epimerase
MRTTRAILVGSGATVRQMSRQLALLPRPPQVIGCVLADDGDVETPYLGALADLEEIVERYRPDAALVSFPAVMSTLILNTRTTLRRLGVADRFLATLEDQVAGVGPRTHWSVDLQTLIGREPQALDEALISTAIQGKNVLITGAGGSIGSELARQCARFNPKSLLLMERSENALFEIDRQIARFFPQLERKAILHDVTETVRTRAIVEQNQAEVIFHAAAHKHVPMMEDHPAHAVHNNIFGTKAIVDAAVATAAERVVMISTDKAVNAVSVMGATKRLAERYVQAVSQDLASSKTLLRIVRFGNVLGSACSVLPIWSKQIEEGGPITVTHPEMTRYFMTIPEAAGLVIQAASLPVGAVRGADSVRPDGTSAYETRGGGGEVFILDMGEPVRIFELAERFIRLHGLEPAREDDVNPAGSSISLVISGVRPGEKLHEELAHANERTAATRHPAIRAWQGDALEASDMKAMLRELEAVSHSDDPQQVLAALARYTPQLGRPAEAPAEASAEASAVFEPTAA